MKKIITTILLFSFILNIKAFENNIFTIDIPETYKETINEKDVYKWEKDNDYISITTNSNKDLKYSVKEYTEEDIKKQKEYIETNINKGLEKYNIKATVEDINKYNKDELYYIEYSIYYPSIKETGHDIYQKGRMYTTNNYITTVIFNSDKKINDEEFNKLLNTLTIKDDFEVIKSANKNRIVTLTVITGILLAIAVFLMQYKRHL